MDRRHVSTSRPCLLGVCRLGDLEALVEVSVPHRLRVLVVVMDDLGERHTELVLEQTRRRRKPDSNPQSLSEKSGRSEMRHIGFRVIWPAQAGTNPGGGPEVRIRLPPAATLSH